MRQLRFPTSWTYMQLQLSFLVLVTLFTTLTAFAQTNWNDRFQFVSVGAVGLIQTAKWDGSDVRSLGNGQNPVWAPDGSKVVFYDHINCSPICLVKVNADGTGRTYIPVPFGGSNAGTGSVSFFPDSQKIAFVGWTRDPNTNITSQDIYSMNLDGSSLVRLTFTPTIPKQEARVSPDGTKIAFSSTSDFVTQAVYMMNSDGSGLNVITTPSQSDIWIGVGEWSPDSTRMARICTESRLVDPELNRYELYSKICLIDTAGGRTDISPSTDYHSQNGNDVGGGLRLRQWYDGPRWSNDASKLLYQKITQRWNGTGWSSYQAVLLQITAEGGGGEEIQSGVALGPMPAYSPDDSMIFTQDPATGALLVLKDGARIPFTAFHTLNGAERLQWQPRPPCACEAIPRPQPRAVQSNWPQVDGVDVNWRMTAEISDDDGLVLKDVRLGDRYLAKQISVPYYVLETSEFASQHNELRPDGTESSMRSRLVKYEIIEDSEKLVIEATYVLDRIPDGSSSCVHVVQRHEFYKQGIGGACEPSDTLPCSRWKPIVKYKFFGRPGQKLLTLKIAQRRHFQVDQVPENTVGLFKDCDSRVPPCGISWGNTLPGMFGFERKSNPLEHEWFSGPIRDGKNLGIWDNIHQTNLGVVDEPPVCWTCPSTLFVGAGCPECMHSHWRWGAFQSEAFGAGNLLIPKGSKQDLDFAIVRSAPDEEDVFDVVQLANDEAIRHDTTSSDSRLRTYRDTSPEDVVVWHVGGGHQNSDVFFGFGIFFSAGSSREVLESPVPFSSQDDNGLEPDGISSVVAGNVFADRHVAAATLDPGQIQTLPIEYTVYNGQSYEVRQENEEARSPSLHDDHQDQLAMSGPYTVKFSVPSVSDQATFDSLRIFHAEQDPYDPTGIVWVDRTVLSPDTPGPDFNSRTITARARNLGPFVLAARTNPQPPPTDAADLSVSIVPSSTQVVTGDQIVYTITVTNQGPQTATDIKLSDSPSPGGFFVALSSSQGSCTEFRGTFVCKLGSLAVKESATVTVTVVAADTGAAPSPSGRSIFNTVRVRANEIDADLASNKATASTLVMPDPNLAPTIEITSPTRPMTYPGPTASVSLSAVANDPDGSISKVEFFDNSALIGTVTSPTNGQYVYSWTGVPLGAHTVTAVATDNLGKMRVSGRVSIFVNGPATVSITSPTIGAQFLAAANVSVNVNASYAAGSIDHVDIFANDEVIGRASSTGTNQYGFNWNGVSSGTYQLIAVVTDNNGVVTRSNPVPITVYLLANRPPQVTITVPFSGAKLVGPSATLGLVAEAVDPDGTVGQVDFYNNGVFLGTGTSQGSNRYGFTWSNIPDGSYTLTAVARDDKGAMTTSAPATFTVNSAALLVAGSTTLTAADTAVRNRLQSLGFTVTVKDGTATSSDAAGKVLVVISSTVSPNVVGAKFRYVQVPVVTWESGILADMGMVPSSNKDYGTASRQTQIQITSGSVLAGGLSGTVTVYPANNSVSWGKPNANAVKVATVSGDATKIAIFGYYTGSLMPLLQAPARRVGFFMFDTTATNQNANAWILFDASINWAVGRIS